MLNKAKIVAVAAVVAILSGCAVYDAGYTENRPVSRYAVPSQNKVPITYSIDLKFERGDIVAAPEVTELRKKIENGLNETGLFSSVSYGSKEGADSYHVEFLFHQAGMAIEDSMGVGLVSGYTLFLVPTMEILTFDSTAVLYLQGKPIYSIAKPEEIRCLLWLPMAPVGIFKNSWTAWHCLEKGSVNALCEAISRQHRKQFLADVPVVKLGEGD